eukprot:PITA_09762
MTGVREYFLELSEDDTDMEVVLGDDSMVRAVGVGTLTFDWGPKPPLKVSDVVYVPRMKKNLISVSTLEDRGYDVLFSRGNTRGRIDNRSSSSELCEIWHRKMGHMYHGALSTLREITTAVPDFSCDHLDVCKGRDMGKFARSPFPSSDNRATEILDLIHTDTKSEVFKWFQEFKALVETQTGRKIKVLRSDNGGEYTLGEFVDFCAEAGIRREFTIPYNPQQNGVVERKNRSIIGVAKAMLHDQGLPLFLWAEACNTAVYLQNRSPHCALGNLTPEEAFSGKKLDVEHVNIFGCLTYSYVPEKNRTKLEPTADKGIFVGYSETLKAYRIYILAQRKVVVRWDVKFEEERAFRRSRELEYPESPDP